LSYEEQKESGTMPTYQYRCTRCGTEFEEFQNITDKPLEICPECGGLPTRLISGGAGFLFKGSGFYITDYRSDSYKQAAKKETGSTADSGSKTEPKKTETKTGGTSPKTAASG
jgi:putative FmdB family regulatory protein